MRDVPATMTAAWRSGNFAGTNRPMGRVTVQRGQMNLFSFSRNLYSSFVFNNPNIPMELPNLKSIRWDRDVDAEVATANIEFYNTKALPLGDTPVGGDRDLKGYYTPTRGLSRMSSRWGHEPNEWQGMLLPDNILRTYEGYGFDPEVCPEDDPFLVQTGVWIIDDVSITSAGTISCQCRDLGRLLIDQIAMQPVIPKNFYPLRFASISKRSGIRPPQEIGNRVAAVPYDAPNDVPANMAVIPGDKSVTVDWDAVPTPAPENPTLPPEYAGTYYRVPAADSDDGYDHYYVRFTTGPVWTTVLGDADRWAAEYLYGAPTDVDPALVPAHSKTFRDHFDGALGTYVPQHEVVGYRVYINGQVQDRVIDENTLTATFDRLMNGAIYSVQVAAQYQVLDNGERYTADRTTAAYFSPRAATDVAVYPSDVEDDTQLDGSPGNGWVRWRYNATDAVETTWNIVIYKGPQGIDGQQQFQLVETVTVGDNYAAFDTGVTDLHKYNIMVFPETSGVGAGGLLLAGGFEVGFYATSGEAGVPEPPPAADGMAILGDLTSTTVAAETRRIVPTFANTSNWPYVGGNGKVYGHRGVDAFDSDPGTYWLSIGNSRPDQGYSYEWVEGTVPSVGVASVEVSTPYRNMMAWISVMVDGKWLAHSPGDVITYDPDHPLSKNGANIPFVATQLLKGGGGVETIHLRQVYGNVTRVRVTFSNLQDSNLGTYQYRAACSEVAVNTVVSQEVETSKPAPQPEVFDVEDGTGLTIQQAFIVSGAGVRPGKYEDYCADTETEILTQRGWLRWDEVEAGDMALAIDPADGVASWQVIESVYRRRRQRTMVSMESAVHSSLTTPDHRWLVTDQQGRRLWRTTETLKTGHRIPVSAPTRVADEAKYHDDFVELVAWFWTEGWFNGDNGSACLAQSETANPEHTRAIRDLLSRSFGAPGPMKRGVNPAGVGPKWREAARADGVVTFRLAKPVKEALQSVMDAEKVVTPEFIGALTKAQLELFIERSIDADGWRTQDGRVAISQANEARAKSFEMALALAGRPFRTRERDGQWVTQLLRHAVTMPQSAKVTEVEYDDYIWCPTLRHHNWFARRNGTTYFTGNTDIVKLLCAWGGFFWPEEGTVVGCDGNAEAFSFGNAPYNLGPNIDPVLGTGTGRVWGDFETAGVAGVADLDAGIFDKKPLMEGINHVKDILGFLFYIDEEGGVVWRTPNIWKLGNWRLTRSGSSSRTSEFITLDERVNLLDLGVNLTSRNVREKVFVGTPDARKAGVAKGWNPNPTGMRRIAGWTDQRFATSAECQLMAELVTLRQLFTYRTDRAQIPAYPAIQINDQVQIVERTTGEGYRHYVKSISSNLDLESGEWVYELGTHWLGEDPQTDWAFDVFQLSSLTQNFLLSTGRITRPRDEVATPTKVPTTFTFEEWAP